MLSCVPERHCCIDSINSEPIRRGHVHDTFVPVGPAAFSCQLEEAGLADVTVTKANGYQFRCLRKTT